MGINEYIRQLEAKNIYFFTREKAMNDLGISGAAFNSTVRRQMDKGRITNLRQGFYLVIPPRYQLLGIVPIQFYIDQLFKWLDRPYYVSLLSAAEQNGSSHQALQKSYVITNAPAMRSIEKSPYFIDFFVRKHWPEKNIVLKSSDAGKFKVSSIALTMVDLINYQNKIGGLTRILHILEELKEDLHESDLEDLISWYPDVSDLQRLGFLLDKFNSKDKLIKIMEKWLANQTLHTILLTPGLPWNIQSYSNKWRVNINNEMAMEEW